jgi:translation elongation factor EF-G
MRSLDEAHAQSANGLCSFVAAAEPLDPSICADLESGQLVDPCLDRAARARVLETRLAMKKSHHVRVWCFGHEDCGANVVISNGSDFQCSIGGDSQDLYHPAPEITGSIESAARWASDQGALCEETLRGTSFSIRAVELSSDAVRRGVGQVVGTARRSLSAAQLLACPTLQEPVVRTELLCPIDDAAAVKEMLVADGRATATLLSEEELSWIQPAMLRITSEMTAAQSLSLPPSLRKFSPVFSFARWRDLSGSSVEDGEHRNLVLALRQWRQLDYKIPSPAEMVQPQVEIPWDELLG